jgi:hypothetical protein
VPRVVAIFGVQGWRWDWVREVHELVFALDADAAGQQQWRQLARQAVLRGKRVAVSEPAAYGGYKDASVAWAAGVLAVGAGPAAAATGGEGLAIPKHLRESWAERVAIMVMDARPPARGSRAPGVGVAPDPRRSAVRCAPRRQHTRSESQWCRGAAPREHPLSIPASGYAVPPPRQPRQRSPQPGGAWRRTTLAGAGQAAQAGIE